MKNKNIHILPTDKPSRLYEFGGQIILTNELTDAFRNQNIYITSDVEIKEGDWFIALVDDSFNIYKSFEVLMNLVKENKYLERKIILTTDSQLIKDGVQKISGEFLEWFIKNPSCEFVEIVNDTLTVGEMSKLPLGTKNHKYKIIIPKQETLEEAVERIFKTHSSNTSLAEGHYDYMLDKEDFKEASLEITKWQQENSNINALYFEIDSLKREIKVLRHQPEKMYSEEEVMSILINSIHSVELKDDKDYTKIYNGMQKWFEQFKKK